jgi:spore coat polysaccharide biosynthesis protein SpsF (cytidylyltransferase family)
MGSSRLPGKVLAPVAGRPLLALLLERLARCDALDAVVVATSDDASDDVLAGWCLGEGVDVHRGPLDDVAARVLAAARARDLEGLVRVCGDSPLIDPALVGRAVEVLREGAADLVSNVVPPRTYPHGQSVEALRADALAAAVALMDEAGDHEHVTPALYRHPERFRIVALRADPPCIDRRLVVDTADDLEALRALVARMRRPQAEHGLAELVELAGMS